MGLTVDERRAAIEVIATLVHIKRTMADLILKPAGVPAEIYQPLLYRRDESTGRTLSKRQIAPFILDALDKRPNGEEVIRAIIEIAADWDAFHLAENEYIARATVQKAREVAGRIALERENEEERSKQEELAKQERERLEFRKHSELLLMMFDDLTQSSDHQRRGYLLQELLNRLFDLHQITVFRSFTRNEGAEQIDGAFIFEGWHYLLECRWREKLANIRELDGFGGQVCRSGKQAMGFFLSINGWSDNVPALLKQNPDKSIVLMDGYDLRCILSQAVDFRDFIQAKIAKLSFDTEPFYSAVQYLKDENG
jgi:hypothetical protein